MTDDILVWILMGVGILGFELAGRKIWWAWYVNIANQILWLIFAIITGYWGLIVGTLFYTYQFSRNAYKWTKEHFAPKAFAKPIGTVDWVNENISGMSIGFTVNSESSMDLLDISPIYKENDD